MSFADVESKKQADTFKKVAYFDTPSGQHTFRILEPDALRVETHYVNKILVACLGEECPICATNKKILVEHPEDFRTIKGWSPRSKRYFVNVYDKTNVKICPNCGTEHKKNPVYPTACKSCNTSLVQVVESPSNKVKLFGFGVTVAEQLNTYETTIFDTDGSPLPLTTFDIMLVATGEGKEKKTTLVPLVANKAPISVEPDQLFDRSNGVVTLTVEELDQLQRGVQLKDIYVARSANKQDAEVKALSSDVESSIKKKISDMF